MGVSREITGTPYSDMLAQTMLGKEYATTQAKQESPKEWAVRAQCSLGRSPLPLTKANLMTINHYSYGAGPIEKKCGDLTVDDSPVPWPMWRRFRRRKKVRSLELPEERGIGSRASHIYRRRTALEGTRGCVSLVRAPRSAGHHVVRQRKKYRQSGAADG